MNLRNTLLLAPEPLLYLANVALAVVLINPGDRSSLGG